MPDELPGSSQMLLDAVMALSSDLDLHSVKSFLGTAANDHAFQASTPC